MKRILVTGGAGFIGSHLCERLMRDGNQVLCIDNFSTGQERNVRDWPAGSWQHGDVRTLSGDFGSEAFPHEIYNLACPASPAAYQRDPIATWETCVLGAYHVLRLADRFNAKVLQASTSEVYGDPDVLVQSETYRGNVNPIGPRACYDEGKRAAETLFMDCHRHRGTRVKIARIFNTYGPRMRGDDGRVVPNFITQALAGAPLTIYGDGSHTRSFCYVDDMVDGLIRLMRTDDEVIGPINLGNPREISILGLANEVMDACGTTVPIVFKPPASDDPQRRRPDIRRATNLLGWRPIVSLHEGLRRTVDYFRGVE